MLKESRYDGMPAQFCLGRFGAVPLVYPDFFGTAPVFIIAHRTRKLGRSIMHAGMREYMTTHGICITAIEKAELLPVEERVNGNGGRRT